MVEVPRPYPIPIPPSVLRATIISVWVYYAFISLASNPAPLLSITGSTIFFPRYWLLDLSGKLLTMWSTPMLRCYAGCRASDPIAGRLPRKRTLFREPAAGDPRNDGGESQLLLDRRSASLVS